MDHEARLTDSLSENGKLFADALQSEIFKLKVRRDARIAVEQEEVVTATGDVDDAIKYIYDPLPTETPYLIPGLIPESGASAIVGETNTGKTAVALEIGASLLSGKPLWGHITPSHTVERVVYVLGEHTCEVPQGLYQTMGLPPDGDFRLIGPERLHPHKALVINGQQQLLAVERMLHLTEGAGLIVFDPLAGFVQGNGAENDNSSMRTLIDSMTLIASRHKAALLLLAHAGKPRMDEQGQEIRRTVYATRGASAVEDALTTIFYLRKATLVKQQRGEGGEMFELLARKRKGISDSDVFKLQRNPETIRHILTNPQARLNVPTLEEKLMLAAKVQRLLESNSKMDTDTAIGLVAQMEDMPKSKAERWLAAVPPPI